jgi:hypothetical protein
MEKKKNPFKELETDHELSPSVKKKVMASVAFTNLIGDFTELFTARLATTAAKMIDADLDPEELAKKKNKKNSDQKKGGESEVHGSEEKP